MSGKIKVSHPELGEIEGQRVPFEIVKEDWNSYRLQDGSIVRVRVIVNDIIRTKQKTPDGEPVVVVRSATLVSVQPD